MALQNHNRKFSSMQKDLSLKGRLDAATDVFNFLKIETWPKNISDDQQRKNFVKLFTEEPQFKFITDPTGFAVDDIINRLLKSKDKIIFSSRKMTTLNVLSLLDLIQIKAHEIGFNFQRNPSSAIMFKMIYLMKWIVLVTDFFKPSLRKKAWDFLTNILKSNEKETRSACCDQKLIHVEILNLCREKRMTVRQASLYSCCMEYTHIRKMFG
jgi:hypothetical protein